MTPSTAPRLPLAAAALAAAALAAAPLAAQRPLLPETSRLDPREPSVAVGDDGRVVITFADGTTIHACVSDDGGASFGEPVEVAEEQALSLGNGRRPRAAVSAEHGLVVTANSGKRLRGRDGDLHAWTSRDGRRWSRRVRVNDVDDASLEGLHGMAAGPDGRIVATWLDQREGRRAHQVMAAVSRDGGRTWEDDLLVYASPEGAVCFCCPPAVAIDREGRAHVIFRNDLDGNRDMYVATSDEDVSAFGPARRVVGESWALRRCPMQGGALAVGADGEIEAVWFQKGRVLGAPLDARGRPGPTRPLGRGRDADLAAGPDGFVGVWSEGGTIRMVSAGEETTFDGRRPAIAGAPDGRGPVVLVYESDAPGPRRVRYHVVASREP